ncbi:hypothetical protein NMY22_g432 [Coprinellus aureogranulatus]|nr:hypothetical protein NMY22_g432 [Coprinellus aureogranulatus]
MTKQPIFPRLVLGEELRSTKHDFNLSLKVNDSSDNRACDKDLTSHLHQIDTFPCAIGEHSDVFRAKRINDDKEENVLAIKTLRAGSSRNPNFEEEVQRRLVNLGHGWVQLSHPNIAKIHGVAYGTGRLPGIVMDYYEAGSVVSFMKSRKVTDDEKLAWVKQIASALKYLHRRKPSVVHGDLRGSNIFVDANGSCTLADVGMVYMTDMPEFTMMKSALTCRWTAPELMDPATPQQAVPGPECTTQSDVFSFAMTIVELFSEDVPFGHKKNDTSVISPIVSGERPELPQYVQENPVLSKLVKDCWAPEPHRRPSMSAVCYRLGLVGFPVFSRPRAASDVCNADFVLSILLGVASEHELITVKMKRSRHPNSQNPPQFFRSSSARLIEVNLHSSRDKNPTLRTSASATNWKDAAQIL